MRSLWNAVSFIAVVNLLALGMFIAWLGLTGRLSESRLEHMRLTFARPVAAAAAEREQQALNNAAEEAQQREAALNENPRPASTAQLAQLTRLDQREAQMMRSLQQERAMLLDQLDRRTRELDDRERQLMADREAWEQSIAEQRDLATDQQFQQAVKQLESLPGKQAKGLLMALIDAGDWDQAVAYLSAMQSRAATKVLKEFKDGADIELAAELLERLRTRGLAAGPSAGGSSTDDATATQSDAGITPGA